MPKRRPASRFLIEDRMGLRLTRFSRAQLLYTPLFALLCCRLPAREQLESLPLHTEGWLVGWLVVWLVADIKKAPA